jgi:hypothetical protein
MSVNQIMIIKLNIVIIATAATNINNATGYNTNTATLEFAITSSLGPAGPEAKHWDLDRCCEEMKTKKVDEVMQKIQKTGEWSNVTTPAIKQQNAKRRRRVGAVATCAVADA